MRIRGPLLVSSTTLALLVLFWPSTADAQRRAVRGGGGSRVVVVHRPYYYAPYYFYDSFYSPYSWWYPSFYGPLPPAYWRGRADNSASVRLQVTPREAEVFVDGYVAGTVDDFDGTFQRLPLPPGEHEIVLYLAGYRTVTQKIYLTPGGTFRIRYAMEPLAPGEQPEPRPTAPPPPPAEQPAAPGDPYRTMPPRHVEEGQRHGSLSLRVQPPDADILIDGESWQTSASTDRLVVQVSAGTHRVEIRKDGYVTFLKSLTVTAGETATLNVSLSRRDQ